MMMYHRHFPFTFVVLLLLMLMSLSYSATMETTKGPLSSPETQTLLESLYNYGVTSQSPETSTLQERHYNLSEIYDLDALRTLYEGGTINQLIRRLVGSNCILVERAEVTPYYACLGCRVEEAMGCIDDMRLNRTGNVRATCKINSMHQTLDNNCCPTFTGSNRVNYMGMSYPEGLRCLQRVGCGDSIFYHDILAECKRTCHYNIPNSDRSICFAGTPGMYLNNLRSGDDSDIRRIYKKNYKSILDFVSSTALVTWTLLVVILSLYLGWY